MVRSRLAILAFCALPALQATPIPFTPGTLLYGTQTQMKIFDVTRGGDLASLNPLSSTTRTQLGQIAFSLDGMYAYVSTQTAILRINRTGGTPTQVATISGQSFSGLTVTADGRIFAATYSGNVYNVTTGGAITSTTPKWATGLSGLRNLLPTANGILAVRQSTGTVVNLGNGGNLSSAPAFASGLGNPLDIVNLNGELYVSVLGSGNVFRITAGGNFTTATPFARGKSFAGLASTRGRLYAMTLGVNPEIYDITGGGDFASATPWARNLQSSSDIMFDAVPGAEIADTGEVTEPGTLLMLASAIIAGILRFRRTTAVV